MIKIILFSLFFISLSHAQEAPKFYYGDVFPGGLQKFHGQKNYNILLKFLYLRAKLPLFLEDCIKQECVTNEDLELAKKISKISYDFNTTGVIYVADQSGKFYPSLKAEEIQAFKNLNIPTNQNLFRINDTLNFRSAISTIGPGPIIINAEKNYNLIDSFKILIHEMGHQAGIIDTDHRELDLFALKFQNFLQQKITSSSLKEARIDSYFIYPAGVVPVSNKNEDLDTNFRPSLTFENSNYFIGLTPLLFKVIPRPEEFPIIANFWYHSLNMIKTDYGYLIRGVLGQINSTSNINKKYFTFEGDFEIAIDINTGKTRVNYLNARPFNQTAPKIKITKENVPTLVKKNEILKMSFELTLPSQESIESCMINSTTLRKNEAIEAILPRHLFFECSSIENLGSVFGN